MNCPFCKKRIEAMTGFQEAIKFRNHLIKCKKNPNRSVLPARVDEDGLYEPSANLTCSSLMEALQIRSESGQ